TRQFSLLSCRIFSPRPTWDNDHPYYVCQYRYPDQQRQKTSEGGRKFRPLADVLDFSLEDAWDERDKVYGILSLVNDWGDEGFNRTEPIIPDYTLPVKEIYQRTVTDN